MTRVILIVAILIATSSCTVVYNTPKEQSGNSTGSTYPSEGNKTDDKPKTIAEAIRFCKNIQEANDIPIACGTTYIEEKPTMLIGFPNMKIGKQWISAFTEYVAGPYCYSANQANKNAFLMFVIQNLNVGKVYSCESGESSEWAYLDDNEGDSKPTNISEAIKLCKNIQQASSIPITCKSNYIQGKLGMFIGFQDMKSGEEWIGAFAEYVGEPFCSSANSANRQAFLFFVIRDMRVGKLYSCESGDVSNWLDLSK